MDADGPVCFTSAALETYLEPNDTEVSDKYLFKKPKIFLCRYIFTSYLVFENVYQS
jgi:hypothetical protein